MILLQLIFMWHIKINCNKIKCDFRKFLGNLIVYSDNLDICQKNDDTGAKLNICHVLTATKLITKYFRRAYIISSLLSSYVVRLIIMVVNNLSYRLLHKIYLCFRTFPFHRIRNICHALRTCALFSSILPFCP